MPMIEHHQRRQALVHQHLVDDELEEDRRHQARTSAGTARRSSLRRAACDSAASKAGTSGSRTCWDRSPPPPSRRVTSTTSPCASSAQFVERQFARGARDRDRSIRARSLAAATARMANRRSSMPMIIGKGSARRRLRPIFRRMRDLSPRKFAPRDQILDIGECARSARADGATAAGRRRCGNRRR